MAGYGTFAFKVIAFAVGSDLSVQGSATANAKLSMGWMPLTCRPCAASDGTLSLAAATVYGTVQPPLETGS